MNAAIQHKSIFTLNSNAMTNMEQRGFYFSVGFGLILVAMIDPPISMLWMSIANILGIGLVTLSILGKRFMPSKSEGGFWIEPKKVTSVFGVVLGVGLSILAIASPPISTAWAAYVHLVSIVLVVHSIIGFDCFLKVKPDSSVKATKRVATVVRPHRIQTQKAA